MRAHDFDFLFGEWSVTHRKLKKRLQDNSEWLTFPGTLRVRPILGGAGNVDENVLHDPAGTYEASSIRIFDPASGNWSIYWMDGRTSGIDKPVVGRFNGPVGQFFNDDVFEGRPIKVRFTYENRGADEARWEQAFSNDGGRSWEPNWTMRFKRTKEA